MSVAGINFKTSYESKSILAKVFKESTLIQYNNINELSNIISLNCKTRYIIRPTKSWVSTGLKKYGLAYEMKRCQIEDSHDN